MRNLSRVGVFAFFVIATFFLAACGAMPPQAAPAKGPKVEEGPRHNANDHKSNGNPSHDGPNHDSNNDRGGNNGKSGSGGG